MRLSTFFKGYLFGLDVGEDILAERLADADGVSCVSYGFLEDCLSWCVPIFRDARPEQAIGVARTRQLPTEWIEEVIVYDCTVEGRWWWRCVSGDGSTNGSHV